MVVQRAIRKSSSSVKILKGETEISSGKAS
jgi:hypothetical protein